MMILYLKSQLLHVLFHKLAFSSFLPLWHIRPRFLLSQAQLRLAQALLLVLVGQILADWIYIGFQQIFPRWTKKNIK